MLKKIMLFAVVCLCSTPIFAESPQKVINQSSLGAFDSKVDATLDFDAVGFGRTLYRHCVLKQSLGFYADRQLQNTGWQVHLADLDLNNVIVNRNSRYSEQLLIPFTSVALAALESYSEIELDKVALQSIREDAVAKGLNSIKARSYSSARLRNTHRLKTLMGQFGEVPARSHLVSYGAGYPELSVQHFVDAKRVTLSVSKTQGGRVLAALINEQNTAFCSVE